MSVSVLPYALGAAGLLKSASEGDRARRQANQAQDAANNEAARRARIQAMVQEMIQGSGAYAESEGDRRAERTRGNFEKGTGRLLESTAGAFRVAGYKPGDSVTSDAVTRVGRERTMKWDELVDGYIQQAKANRMSEAGALASSAGITGPNQEYYSNLARSYEEKAAGASDGILGGLSTIFDQAQRDRNAREGRDSPVAPPAAMERIPVNMDRGGFKENDPLKGMFDFGTVFGGRKRQGLNVRY